MLFEEVTFSYEFFVCLSYIPPGILFIFQIGSN